MFLLHKTIGECLQERAIDTPNLTAAGYLSESYTWQQMNQISDYIAVRCIEMGIQKGTHVGIWAVNSFNWIVYFFALVKIGAVPVLINICYREIELENLLAYADVEILLHGIRCKNVDYSEVIKKLDCSRLPKLRQVISMETAANNSWRGNPHKCILTGKKEEQLRFAKNQVHPSDTACMLFTSGTTAVPKGVMLTHYSLVNNSAQHSDLMHWTNQDKMCIAVPLFHCFGITAGILSVLHCGASVQLVKYYSTLEVLHTIQTHRCTILNGVPSMFLALINNSKFCDYDTSSIRSSIIAGSPCQPEDFNTLCTMFENANLQMAYGQTESSPCITMTSYDDTLETKVHSSGKAIPNVEVIIWDNTANREVKAGERGEIRTRGYHVMQGYYKLPQVTADTITPDGWLKTGDEGYLDANGYLHVTGRIKDIIIRGGENISPMEVESCLYKLRGIHAVHVIGLPTKVMQEKVVACVILKHGEALNEQQVITYAKQHLSSYKAPQHVLFFKNFPMTHSGKINRRALKEKAEQMILTDIGNNTNSKHPIVESKEET